LIKKSTYNGGIQMSEEKESKTLDGKIRAIDRVKIAAPSILVGVIATFKDKLREYVPDSKKKAYDHAMNTVLPGLGASAVAGANEYSDAKTTDAKPAYTEKKE